LTPYLSPFLTPQTKPFTVTDNGGVAMLVVAFFDRWDTTQ